MALPGFFSDCARPDSRWEGRGCLAAPRGIPLLEAPDAGAVAKGVGHIDMMVTGASAIAPSGIRFGKRHGYWDMLSSCKMADASTVIIGAGHDCQVADVDLTVEEYDTAIDYIVTPTRILKTRHEFPCLARASSDAHSPPECRSRFPGAGTVVSGSLQIKK